MILLYGLKLLMNKANDEDRVKTMQIFVIYAIGDNDSGNVFSFL